MKKGILILVALIAITFVSNAQTTKDCDKTCEITKIVEEGPLLGVQIKNGPGNKNAEVIRVLPKTSAEKNGIAVGDVIFKVDGIEVKTNYHLVDIIGAHKPGDKVVLTYIHAGKEITQKVRIGAKNTKFVTEKICCEEVKNSVAVIEGLSLYPNPAKEVVSVISKENLEGIVNISIYNMEGKEVYFDTMENTGTLSTKLNISDYTSGEYIVRVNNATKNYTAKLFISK